MADDDLPVMSESQWASTFGGGDDDLPTVNESDFNQMFTGGQKFAGGIANMIPFNVGDEAMAGLRSVVDAVQGEDIGNAYDRNLNQIRSFESQFEKENPYTSIFSSIAGSAPLAVAAPTGISSKLPLAKNLMQAGIEGAGWGAAYGYGAGEGGIENRTAEAAKQALIGEVAAPVVVLGFKGLEKAAAIPGKTFDFVRSFFRSPENIAASKLAPAVDDIARLPTDSANPFYTNQTLAEATQSPYLAQLEQQVGKELPAANELLNANRMSRKQMQLDALENLSPSAPLSAEEGGAALRQLLEPQANRTRKAVGEIYQSIDPTRQSAIPLDDVATPFRNSLNTMYEAGGAPTGLTSIERDLSRTIGANSAAQTRPFSYMNSLRQRAQDAYIAATNVGDGRAAATANGLVRQIDTAIDSASRRGGIAAEDAVRFDAAKAAWSDFANRYQEGPVGLALRKMGQTYQIGDSAVVGTVFNGKAENTRALLNALPDDPAAISQARGLARDKIIRETSNNDGFISPGKFQTYLRKNYEGLEAQSKTGARLFEPEHLKSIDQVADDMAFLDPSSSKSVKQLAYKASEGQPTTAQALIQSAVSKGSGLLPGGRIAEKIGGIFLEGRATAANEILTKALFDKDFAKLLASKATPQTVQRAAGVVEKMFEAAGRKTPIGIGAITGATSEAPRSNYPIAPQNSGSIFSVDKNEDSVFALPKTKAAKEALKPIVLKTIEKVENSRGKTSPVGAQGTYQLMPAMQKSLGVKDPFDDKEAGEAAWSLYSEELERFKDPQLAFAAYNLGSPKLLAAIKKAGSKDWKDIAPHVPKETRDYVAKAEKVLSELDA